MRFITGFFALIGVLTVAMAVWKGPELYKYKTAFDSFDGNAFATYKGMADRLVDTGNAAAATVWRAKVADGLSFEEVDETIKAVASDRNIRGIGELPLGDEVSAINGTPWRKLNIYLYCNPLTAAKMIEYDLAYAAYMPCRVSLVEDETGQLWIYTQDMDMMIYGGKPLPTDLLEEALEVKSNMLDILARASQGNL